MRSINPLPHTVHSTPFLRQQPAPALRFGSDDEDEAPKKKKKKGADDEEISFGAILGKLAKLGGGLFRKAKTAYKDFEETTGKEVTSSLEVSILREEIGLHIQKNQYKDALDKARTVAKSETSTTDDLVQLATLEKNFGAKDGKARALAAMQKAVEKDPENDRFKRIVAKLEEDIAANGPDVGATTGPTIAEKARLLDKAAEKALKPPTPGKPGTPAPVNPAQYAIKLQQANELLAKGTTEDTDKAILNLFVLAASVPRSGEVAVTLVKALLANKRTDQAIKTLETALKAKPDSNVPELHATLAQCLWDKGRKDYAVHELELATGLAPDNQEFKTKLEAFQKEIKNAGGGGFETED